MLSGATGDVRRVATSRSGWKRSASWAPPTQLLPAHWHLKVSQWILIDPRRRALTRNWSASSVILPRAALLRSDRIEAPSELKRRTAPIRRPDLTLLRAARGGESLSNAGATVKVYRENFTRLQVPGLQHS